MVNAPHQVLDLTRTKLCICIGKWRLTRGSGVPGLEPFPGSVFGLEDLHGQAKQAGKSHHALAFRGFEVARFFSPMEGGGRYAEKTPQFLFRNTKQILQ